jgi:spore coat polysaccharide biosynthesis protein SpsF
MSVKVVLIIQARMGSIRLPGKSMMDLAGAPLVGRILERVKRVNRINQIVLATSDQKQDDILEELAYDYNVDCFRGSENDLVDRYYQCAKFFKADVVLRLPADNPFPESSEYNRLIDYHINSDNDFSSNICNFMSNGYPDGIGIEAFNFSSLEIIWNSESYPEKREHVALNFYDYNNDTIPDGSSFKVGTIQCPKEYSRPDIILDVNTEGDYHFMKKLYDNLYPTNPNFSFTEIINWYDNCKNKRIV